MLKKTIENLNDGDMKKELLNNIRDVENLGEEALLNKLKDVKGD